MRTAEKEGEQFKELFNYSYNLPCNKSRHRSASIHINFSKYGKFWIFFGELLKGSLTSYACKKIERETNDYNLL